MSNNIYDDTVSEKAVWEGYITSDEITARSPQIQGQTQSLMMFCYKCNNVIPGDSKFCPYCQTELYTECPKCGAKYSSQYPSCSQCGTNREDFLQRQRELEWEQEEIERKKRLEREKIEQENNIKYKARSLCDSIVSRHAIGGIIFYATVVLFTFLTALFNNVIAALLMPVMIVGFILFSIVTARRAKKEIRKWLQENPDDLSNKYIVQHLEEISWKTIFEFDK